jgi:sec-independent protein translocase protein TatA
MGILSPTHLIIILAIVLIIFGPSRLPQLGKSLGKTMKAIRDGAEGEGDDEQPAKPKAAKAAAKPAVNDNDVLEDDEE